MGRNWPKLTLEEAGVKLLDCEHKTPPPAPDGYPYVAIPQIKDGRLNLASARRISREHYAEWTRKTRPQEDDVIVVRRCSSGDTAVVPRELECALGQNLVLLRADGTRILPEYLRWLLRGPQWWGQVHTYINVGAVFDSLRCRDIPHFTLPVPPRPEQKAIARVLGAFDDKIELNRRMNETLEATARAIFKSWFVDFDPVHAKAASRAPKGLDPATAALFPDSFEDSPLGEIPKGWSGGTLADEFGLTMGQSPPGSTYNEGGDGLPFFQGRRDFGFRYPERRVYCTAPTRLAEPGDALVTVRAPVGDVNMASDRCCVGRGVAAVQHRSGSRSYTYYAMQSLRERFGHFEAEGTVFGSISKSDFAGLDFIRPSARLVQAYETAAFPLDQQIENLVLESRTLAATRDALLPKLLSGELRVKDAEHFAKEGV